MDIDTSKLKKFGSWAKRRWWMIYLLLLGLSHAGQMRGDAGENSILATQPVKSVEVEVWDDREETRSRMVRMSYLHWWEQSGAEADDGEEEGAGEREADGGSGAEDEAEEHRDRPAIVLLHGTPGAAWHFGWLAPRLAERGYDVYAVDLPGFGNSEREAVSYSFEYRARALRALLEELGIERPHIVAWSQGTGVALHLIDNGGRGAGAAGAKGYEAASLTFLSAIGAQETEGSGDYHFERAKYVIAYAGLVVIPELVPHFGVMGAREDRRTLVRSFLQGDQRPLRGMMARLDIPVLILHGRRDFLIADWAAEEHYRIMPASRLVMFDSQHFLPWWRHGEPAADHLLPFLARHDERGVMALRGVADLAPKPSMWLARLGDDSASWFRRVPLVVLFGLVMLAALLSERLTLGVLSLLIAVNHVDFALAGLAVFAAGMVRSGVLYGFGAMSREGVAADGGRVRVVPRVCRLWFWEVGAREVYVEDWRRRWRQRPTVSRLSAPLRSDLRNEAAFASGAARSAVFWVWTPVVLLARTVVLLIVSGIVGASIADPPMYTYGWAGVGLAVAAVWLAVTITEGLATWTGRRMLRARVARAMDQEFWPSWLFYLPLFPWLAYLAIRYRGTLLAFCCNPGIGHGGGVVGESKHWILTALPEDPEVILPHRFIADGLPARERAEMARRAVAEHAELAGYPVIVKPDSAQRGFAVKLIRRGEEFDDYFGEMTRAAIVQRYHAGPHECGILWVRDPTPPVPPTPPPALHGASADDADAEIGADGAAGFLFSITRKLFPGVTGDGRRTLEQLIYKHPRFRCQARVFLERFAARRTEVIPRGEQIRLGQAGNHCQGTLFYDGKDLITPALSERIDRIARAFRDPSGRGLDFGRFDVRYESEELLKAGRGFAILELNGTTGESTNIYDPRKSILWTYSVLYRQWALLYRLGAARRDAGEKPMSPRDFLLLLRGYYRNRPGNALAD